MLDRNKLLFSVALASALLVVSAGAVAASSHTGDGSAVSTTVDVSPDGEGEQATYTAEFTFGSVGNETAQFVSVAFGSDADYSAAVNESNDVSVSGPDGSNLDVAGTLDAGDNTLVIQLGDTISDANENDTYTVEVAEVVNAGAGDYDLTLGLHDEGDEILDAAAPAFAAHTAGYTVGGGVATVSFEDQTTAGDSVVVASTSLPEGGFVTVHDSSVGDDAVGSVVGVSDYLESGESEGVTVELDETVEEDQTLIAMPHLDTNGNEGYDFVSSEGGDDGPYTADGGAVVDPAQVTVEGMDDGMDDGNESDGMDGGMDNGSDTDGADGADDDGEGGEDGGQGLPGFTAVAALVALVAAAFVARRAQ